MRGETGGTSQAAASSEERPLVDVVIDVLVLGRIAEVVRDVGHAQNPWQRTGGGYLGSGEGSSTIAGERNQLAPYLPRAIPEQLARLIVLVTKSEANRFGPPGAAADQASASCA
jgi:hypothetical protein